MQMQLLQATQRRNIPVNVPESAMSRDRPAKLPLQPGNPLWSHVCFWRHMQHVYPHAANTLTALLLSLPSKILNPTLARNTASKQASKHACCNKHAGKHASFSTH